MEPFARTIDAAKKHVVSSSLERVDWNAKLVRGDRVEVELTRSPADSVGALLAEALTLQELAELQRKLVEHQRGRLGMPTFPVKMIVQNPESAASI
jgi:hypothetical protein